MYKANGIQSNINIINPMPSHVQLTALTPGYDYHNLADGLLHINVNNTFMRGVKQQW